MFYGLAYILNFSMDLSANAWDGSYWYHYMPALGALIIIGILIKYENKR